MSSISQESRFGIFAQAHIDLDDVRERGSGFIQLPSNVEKWKEDCEECLHLNEFLVLHLNTVTAASEGCVLSIGPEEAFYKRTEEQNVLSIEVGRDKLREIHFALGKMIEMDLSNPKHCVEDVAE